ncbi:uncharacterized protein EV422DRAFT_537352 [Fimicolochytrium jonesii]|uniref:uncharacterized protein n=1 Tax=Fimicolochytrium jonesii TaxID=1396493 RepID=UPI0022FDB86A|nr:uncharacterized protein EV422DRAFT_537352 [Fimicolochytrium jonesii]KAI8818518.1 hypothetical protein EV422DRAFT_537352 [Fimicolochytrium jonesii]
MESKLANSKGSLRPSQAPPKAPKRTKPARWNPLPILLELGIMGVCIASLALGNLGYLSLNTVPQSAAHWNLWSEQLITFGYGIVVQIALLGPLQLGRKICQLWLASKIVSHGIPCRQMVTAWSAIYCNSHRGVEDIWRGWITITLFMLTVYIAEIVVIGGIGSLYYKAPLTAVRFVSPVPLLGPFQSNMTTFEEGPYITELALRTILSLGQLYDPMTLDGLLIPNSTLSDCSETGCTGTSSVILSPMAPSASTEGAFWKWPWPGPWESTARNDRVIGEVSSLSVDVSCSPQAFYINKSVVDYWYYQTNAPDGTPLAYANYALETWYIRGPQVSLVSLEIDDHDAEHFTPYVLDDRVYFGVLTNNLDGTVFENMDNSVSEAHKDLNATVQYSTALCSAGVKLGKVAGIMEILSVTPSLKASISSAQNATTPTSYPLSKGTSGYPMAFYLSQFVQYVTCDILGCSAASGQVPWFDTLIGMLQVDAAGNAIVDPANQMKTISVSVARLLALSLASFTTELLDPATNTTLTAEYTVKSNEISHDIYNSRGFDILLIVGLVCGFLLLIWDGIMKVWCALAGDEVAVQKRAIVIGMTESIYMLLKGFERSQLNTLLPDLSKSTPEGAREAVDGQFLEVDSEVAGLVARRPPDRAGHSVKTTKDITDGEGDA